MGLIKTITTYPGTKSSNTTTVNIYVNFSEDNENYYASTYCTAVMRSGYWVQSSGLMFYSSATGRDKQGASSICGNTYGGTKHWGGTTYTSSTHYYSWSKSTSDKQSIGVYVDVYRSTDYASDGWTGSGEAYATIGRKKVWNNINAFRIDNSQENGARFDLSIYNIDSDSWTEYYDLTNEPSSFYYPYGSIMNVYNIRPIAEYADTWEIDSVTGYDSRVADPYDPNKRKDGRYRDPDGNTVFCNTINGDGSAIQIYTRWKQSTVTFDADGGSGGNSVTVSYNQDANTAPVSTRSGYKFHGWYTERDRGGNKIYNADGSIVKGTAYWNANGKCTIKNNLTLYAGWEIQNIAYVKISPSEWRLATIYVKTSDTEWKPAIMYVKTSDTEWTQSGI